MTGEAADEDDPDLVPISALQHHLFCPRQCALIHVERTWAESALTAEGRIAHAAVHAPKAERRQNARVSTGMPLCSRALGLAGVADVVELRTTPAGLVPFPVEHKLGRPKEHRADEVQLCAQALCLEEMLGVPVRRGAIFYGRIRRRHEVAFDAALRDLTRRTASEVRAMLAAGRTPPAEYRKERCDTCSLLDLCRPKALQCRRPVGPWLARLVEDDGCDAT